MQEIKAKQILLVGNPNVGKSTVFNWLCNKKQKTGNYAGVTVASHLGELAYKDQTIEVIDLPGAYSIYPSSEDEAIFSKYLIEESANYSGVVYVLEALSVKRGLLLLQQIQDLGVPVLVVLNQIDQAEKRGIYIDINELKKELGVNVIPTNAKKGVGLDELREAIYQDDFITESDISFEIPMEQRAVVKSIASKTQTNNEYKVWTLLASETRLQKVDSIEDQLMDDEVKCLVPKRLQTQETIRRYQKIDGIISRTLTKKPEFKELLTEALDKVLVHKVFGYVVFILILLLIFQMVFYIAAYPMDWIDTAFLWLSETARNNLPESAHSTHWLPTE